MNALTAHDAQENSIGYLHARTWLRRWLDVQRDRYATLLSGLRTGCF